MKHLFSFLLTVAALAILGQTALTEPVYLTAEDRLDDRAYSANHLANDEPALPQNKTSASQALSVATGTPDIVARFESAVPWASGVNSSGETFGGSIFSGGNFFGSALTGEDLVSVEIRFSDTDTTWAAIYRRDVNYTTPTPPGVFPGTVWDVSDPDNHRRLNVCFAETYSYGVNQTFDPDASSYGKREYLYIMASDYDGDGTTYLGTNGYYDAPIMDILYNWWPKVADGHTFMESLPATLFIDTYHIKKFRGVPNPTEITLTWDYQKTDPTSFEIYGGSSPNPTTLLHSATGSDRSFWHSSLTSSTSYYYKIEAVTGGEVVDLSPEIEVPTTSESANATVVGFWNERERYGDCWGYTDPVTSKEYALICARNEGVSIIDIDVTPPVEVGFIPSMNVAIDSKDVKIYQHYAIVVNEGDAIQIVDITDVTSPVQVGLYYPDGGGSHNCLVEGDYLYVVGNHGTGGVEIVDISDPTAPVEVGQSQPFYYHDIDIRNDTLCGTGIYGNGIDLIDVSDKTNPQFISRFNYAGSGAHNAEFSYDGKYVFIGDEIGSSGNHTRVFDISDPFDISMVSEIIVDPQAVVHNCYVLHDTLLVIAHYTEGVRVWNVKDPVNPFEVAYYDTYLQSGYGYNGCWSVYPYFESGKIIASDMQTGLYVIELDFPPCCEGLRGDVNGDGSNKDIVDLTCIVDYLFGAGCDMPCLVEADLNGDGASADIVDLTHMVDFLFGIAPTAVACP